MTPAWFPSAMILAAALTRPSAPPSPRQARRPASPDPQRDTGAGANSNARLPRAAREAADPPELLRGV
jgi:hypothetical protein